MILDVYQAAGTIPLATRGARGADFAVGGSVKWLCGGPGAGYLYVRPDLARESDARRSSAGRRTPRRSTSRPGAPVLAESPERFQSGTPNIPSLYAARSGYEIVGAIGVEAIRARSLALTRRMIDARWRAGWR